MSTAGFVAPILLLPIPFKTTSCLATNLPFAVDGANPYCGL